MTVLTQHRLASSVRGWSPRGRKRLEHLLMTAVLLLALDLCACLPHILAARLVAVAIVVVLPGATLLAAARLRFASLFVRLAGAVGGSLMLLMAWAAASSALLPPLGLSRPIATVPLLMAVNVGVLGMALLAPHDIDPVLDQLGTRLSATSAALLVVPLVAVASVELLNGGHGSTAVQVVIGVVTAVLVAGFVQATRERDGSVHLILFVVALSLAYLYSYRGGHLYGYDIQEEYQRFVVTYRAGRWRPPSDGNAYAAMLSITALPAALSRLTGVSGLYLFKGFYPLVLSFVPGLTFEFARRWLPARAAYVGAAYLVVLADFASQLPALARQEVGFFYFALLLLLPFDASLRGARRQAVVLVVLGALVVSHYSTSYVTVAVLAVTWVVYGLVRLVTRGRHRARQPFVAVTFLTAAVGISMILVWDVGVTHSAGDITQFADVFAAQGPDLLPNAHGGSLVTQYLDGNVGGTLTPARYYALARRSSRATQPWLDPYPAAITDRYPAQAATPPTTLHQLFGGARTVVSDGGTIADELFVFLTGAGVLMSLFQYLFRRQRFRHSVCAKKRRIPPEGVVLGVAFLAFLLVVRVSGTVVGSYNSSRAQLQGAIVLAPALGLVAEWMISHARHIASSALVAGLVVLLLTGIGETAELGGGVTPVLLGNSGTGYDQFFVTDDEVAAARWMIEVAGQRPLIYTDDNGMLPIRDATGLDVTQTLLTPSTISRGAWVYADTSDVEGRSYGTVDGSSAIYRFPDAFLDRVDDVLYSGPTARVYR